jgi:predicted O-methyltransferase YrrM
MSLADPYAGSIRYPDYMHLAVAIKPDARRVLVLGLGGGSITKRFWRDYPAVRVDTVEIDPVVFDVAKRYFALPSDSRLRNYTEDGRRFVQHTTETYDIVIIDAYTADALPFHLTTDEFFREIKKRLAPDGVVAYNVIGSIQGERSKLFRSIYRTANGVWQNVWAFPIGLGADGVLETNRNIIMLASDVTVPDDELEHRIESRVGGMVTIPGFESFASDWYKGPVEVSGVPLLTDAHAPTDSLIHVN